MVGVDGIPRLLDFGVAKAVAQRARDARGGVQGQARYTAPEVLQGRITQSADLYATAVVLWEALAGRRLYPGLREAELVAAVMAGVAPRLTAAVDPASVSKERWELLTKLDPMLDQAMAFAPEDRYPTAAAMQAALLEAAPPRRRPRSRGG